MKPNFFLPLFALLLYSCSADEPTPEVITEIKVVDKVFDGWVYLVTQEALDDFAQQEYTIVTGSVQLGSPIDNSSFIADLSAIKSLRKVGGGLRVMNTNTKDLANFANLDTVMGEFVIAFNHELVTFSGMKNLKHVGEQFHIALNNKQTDFNGMPPIEFVQTFSFNQLPSLTNLNGISNIKRVDHSGSIYLSKKLTDFCAIRELLTRNSTITLNVYNNAFNPNKDQIIAGNCKS